MSDLNRPPQRPITPIAIVGMGALFPEAQGRKEFWRLLFRGKDTISEVPETHWGIEDYFDADPKKPDSTYCRRGGFLSAVPFDPTEFGIPPTVLEATDTSQLLSLVVAKMALEDAGYGDDGRPFDRERVSVVMGVTGTQELVVSLGARLGHPIWRKALLDAGIPPDEAEEIVARISDGYVPWQENSFPGLLGNVVAGRIASRLDFGGTNSVLDAACASSLSAMHLGILELQAGVCDMVLTGGVDALNDIFMYMCFSKTPALSPTGDLRPFSADADGTIIGEGIGIVALKRLDDAKRDGDSIYAVIRGMGSSSDGRSQSIYAPRAAGQMKAIERCYAQAGVSPQSIELVEAHGTGTKVGDAVEFDSLREVFARPSAKKPWVALGSVKSQIGHTKSAAGAASVIKAALSLYHKVLPPTLKISQPNPRLNIEDSAFYLNTELRPWLSCSEAPRRAGVSSFGFGGSNFHVLLEEVGPEKPKASWSGAVEIVPLSGASVEALRSLVDSWVDFLSEAPNSALVASRAYEARRHFDAEARHRLVLVLDEEEHWSERFVQARQLLKDPLAKRAPHARMFYGESGDVVEEGGKLALLFPGQGSQYVGMGRDLACTFPEVFEAIERADRSFGGDVRLSEAIFPNPVFSGAQHKAQSLALADTRIAQPAIGAISVGFLRLLEKFGIKPHALAGHSYGELVALHAAGVLSEDDLFALSKIRGELMGSNGSERGTMIAVLAPLDELDALLERTGGEVVLANRNSPGQGVLSGSRESISLAEKACQSEGWRTFPLPVSAAFHSPLVADAQAPFASFLETMTFGVAAQSVFSNVTASEYPVDSDAARALLAQQLTSPVDFVGEIKNLAAMGVNTFVEVGPKGVLTRLTSACLEEQPHVAIAMDSSSGRRCGLLDFACLLSQLAALGFPVELALWEEKPISVRKQRMTVPLTGANYRKTYLTEFGRKLASRTWTPPEPRAPQLPKSREAVVTTGSSTTVKFNKPSDHQMISRPTGHDRSKRMAEQKSPQMVPLPSQVSTTLEAHNSTVVKPQANAQNPPQGGEFWTGAFQVVQEGLRSMQALQAQTALNHQRFLDVQESAQRSLQEMMLSSQQLVGAAMGVPMAARTPQASALSPQAPAPAPAMPQVALQQAAYAGLYAPVAVSDAVSHGGQQSDIAAPGSVWMAAAQGPAFAAAPMNMASQPVRPAPPIATPAPLSAPHNGMTARVQNHGAASESGRAQTAAVAVGKGALRERAEQIILEVVAELTGYPAEMLSLEMDMEADLGIDSIKRVEILSTVSERLPEASQVDPEHMGGLRTLDQIVEHLVEISGGQQAQPVSMVPSVSSGSAPVEATLLEVVAELTGYPAEMLSLEMDMEADLGIDSIKRVEILSAVTERLPQLAEAETEALRNLRTLQEIVDSVSSLGGAVPFDQAPPQTPDLGRGDTASFAGNGSFEEEEVEPVKRQILRAVKKESASRPSLHLPAGSRVLVVAQESTLARSIVDAFSDNGRMCSLANPQEAVAQILEKHPAAVVFVAPEASAKEGLDEGQSAFLKEAFLLTQRALPSLSQALSQGDALFATVTCMDGRFGLSSERSFSPVQGGLAGLTKTLKREEQGFECRAIDISPGSASEPELAALIVAECLQRGGPIEVGFDGKERFELALDSVPTKKGSSLLKRGDVVVITGGARGVTAEVAFAMGRHLGTPLVLLGRSPLPDAEPEWLSGLHTEKDIKNSIFSNGLDGEALRTPALIERAYQRIVKNREILNNIERIKSTGVPVRYFSVDVRDAQRVGEIFAEVRHEVGAIRGVIHGAGVLEDRLIADKSGSQFSMVYDTKVDGLRALLKASASDDLSSLVLFSSVSGRAGNQGQVDYAMANEVLNKVAQVEAAKRPSCRVVSLNWGPWDGGMVTPVLKTHFERQGVTLIPLKSGARALLDELEEGNQHEVEVILGDIFEDVPSPEEEDSDVSESSVLSSEHFPLVASANLQNAMDAKPTDAYEVCFVRDVSIDIFPVLDDHRLKGTCVVPLAVLMEWFGHGALHRNPGLVLVGYENVRVLKGFRLGDVETRTMRVVAQKSKKEGAVFRSSMELRSSGSDESTVLHARADALLALRAPVADAELELPVPGRLETQRLNYSVDLAYQDVLFHGSSLRGIQSVHRLDASGMLASVASAPPPKFWTDKPMRRRWTHDPLVLDCAFQMAILWCHDQKGLRSLPTYFSRFEQYQKFANGPVLIQLEVTETTPHKMRGDFLFINPEGELLARMTGYECAMDASLQQAFGQPHVIESTVR